MHRQGQLLRGGFIQQPEAEGPTLPHTGKLIDGVGIPLEAVDGLICDSAGQDGVCTGGPYHHLPVTVVTYAQYQVQNRLQQKSTVSHCHHSHLYIVPGIKQVNSTKSTTTVLYTCKTIYKRSTAETSSPLYLDGLIHIKPARQIQSIETIFFCHGHHLETTLPDTKQINRKTRRAK